MVPYIKKEKLKRHRTLGRCETLKRMPPCDSFKYEPPGKGTGRRVGGFL